VAEEYSKIASPERFDVEPIAFFYVSPILVNPVGLIDTKRGYGQ
jgi:hypothetical protein